MKKDKYQISYTLKSPGLPGYHRELFKTKKEANSWFKKNKDEIYWHQLTECEPKSSMPRPIVKFEPNENFIKKTGTLQTYFETGMECLGLAFYEDGIHGSPNPDFNPSMPEGKNNFKYFSSHEGMTFIENGHILGLPNGERVGMLKDRDFAKRDGYRLSFYPQGFSKSEILELFYDETVKVTIWIPVSKHEKDLKKFIRGPF